jgi:hypothetical protein
MLRFLLSSLEWVELQVGTTNLFIFIVCCIAIACIGGAAQLVEFARKSRSLKTSPLAKAPDNACSSSEGHQD